MADDVLPDFTVGDALAMFDLGFVEQMDMVTHRKHTEEILRRRRMADMERSNIILDVLKTGAHEMRPCKLCGAELYFIGSLRVPFGSDGRRHAGRCPGQRKEKT